MNTRYQFPFSLNVFSSPWLMGMGYFLVGIHLLVSAPSINLKEQQRRGAEIPQVTPSAEDLKADRFLPNKKNKQETPEEENDPRDQEEIVPELKGVVLLANPETSGVTEIDGELIREGISSQLPLRDSLRFEKQLSPFLGKPLLWKGIRELKREITDYFMEQERQAVRVVVPQQEILDGVLLVHVFQGKIGEIQVQGNRWVESQRILRSFGFKPGDPLDPSALRKRLNYMNHNSFIQSDLIINAEDRSQLTLQVKDRFPVRFFSGYEDSGSDVTGDVRWFGGFNWGDAFFQGHTMSYQFLTTSDTRYLKAHSLSYEVPLSWGHDVRLQSSFSRVRGDFAEIDQFDLRSRGMDLGLYYSIPLPRILRWDQELSFGVEHKRSESFLSIEGVDTLQSVTEVDQLAVHYEGGGHDRFGRTSFEVNGYYSPGGMTGANSPSSFRRARQSADPEYRVLSFLLERRTDLLWGVYLRHEFRYQMTSGNVLGSEQFGLGGWNSVRGYEEREVSTDEGWLLRQEIWSPQWSFGEWMTQADWGDFSWVKDSLQGCMFWDYGVGSNRILLDKENPDIELSSLGIGARYRIDQYVTLRADYGFQLLSSTSTNKRSYSRFHVGVLISY